MSPEFLFPYCVLFAVLLGTAIMSPAFRKVAIGCMIAMVVVPVGFVVAIVLYFLYAHPQITF